MKIRAAAASDLPFMMDLAFGTPSAAHWTEQQYRDVFSAAETCAQRLALVAESVPDPDTASLTPGTLLGFLVARHLVPEWELENIVVIPSARRTGVGKRLLDALISAARQANSASVFLEVRESNQAARSLYEKAGFLQTGRRKSYYTQPAEDAILYRLSLQSQGFSP